MVAKQSEVSEINRLRIGVMQRLAVTPDENLVVNDRGEQALVFALADESLGVLAERLMQAGGYATVFVGYHAGVYKISVVKSSGALELELNPMNLPLTPDTHVSEMIEYMLSGAEKDRHVSIDFSRITGTSSPQYAENIHRSELLSA